MLRALRPLRTVRAILVMVASWMSLVTARPLAAAESGGEPVASASIDASVTVPIARYAVVGDRGAASRTSRATPLALFLCAVALLAFATATSERARADDRTPPRVVDPRVAPYDAMAPPALQWSPAAL